MNPSTQDILQGLLGHSADLRGHAVQALRTLLGRPQGQGDGLQQFGVGGGLQKIGQGWPPTDSMAFPGLFLESEQGQIVAFRGGRSQALQILAGGAPIA